MNLTEQAEADRETYMNSRSFIDLHCDTLLVCYIQGKEDFLDLPGTMLDIRRMKEGGASTQFFAIFMMPPGAEKFLKVPLPDDREYVTRCLRIFRSSMEQGKDSIAQASSTADILNNERAGKMSALLTFEDGRLIDGTLENLERYYQEGIRLISLTWNTENCFGYPNSQDREIMEKGLKPFGKEAVLRMNELGIVVDVSHLSDGGFFDVAKISRKPFVASHSNCRALSPWSRNLSDEMIKILADKGGVMGLNYGPPFVGLTVEHKDSTLELMSAHIRHMIRVGGIGCAALGSDFDGIEGNFEVSGPDKVPLLFDRLQKDGLSESDIEKIARGNALRVLTDVLDG
jgi:membrane dipeptidase